MITLIACALIGGSNWSQSLGRDVEYKVGNDVMQGYVAVASEVDMLRPVVVVVHDWNGIDNYEKMRADMLARMGYVAVCADIYGKGIRPKNTQESSAEASKYYRDLNLFRTRVQGAVTFAKGVEGANANQVAAIGYCFGGTAVLELARSGANVRGVASFHGGLKTAMPMKKGAFKGEVAIYHGADDPFVPQADVDAVKQELSAADVDFDFVSYAGAVHSFTHKDSGAAKMDGVAYNENADKDSWAKLTKFLAAIFSK